MILLAIVAALPQQGQATAMDQAADCRPFIAQAERHFHLPPGLLGAIALTESGQGGAPYPWALNIDGEPLIAPDFAAAAALLRRPDGHPRRDVAIGCMQIHMQFHLQSFTDPEWALQPGHNVWYAAQFLDQLYRRYGDWLSATAHYHASAPAAQRRYLCQVGAHLRATGPGTGIALGLAGCPAGDLAPRGPAYPRRAQSPEERQRSAIMAARQAGGIILLGAKSR